MCEWRARSGTGWAGREGAPDQPMGAWSARPALPGLEERGKGRGEGSEGAEPRRRSRAQHPKPENQTGSGERETRDDPRSDRSGAGKMTGRGKEGGGRVRVGNGAGAGGAGPGRVIEVEMNPELPRGADRGCAPGTPGFYLSAPFPGRSPSLSTGRGPGRRRRRTPSPPAAAGAGWRDGALEAADGERSLYLGVPADLRGPGDI